MLCSLAVATRGVSALTCSISSKASRKMSNCCYLNPAVQSYIITSFCYPDTKRFSFDAFYQRLSDQGFIIYPGKISQANTFRIGSIGRIFPSDIAALLSAIASALKEMGIKLI